MNTKTRYLLLLAGFIVFLLIAPLIILYISGITFDYQSKSFIRTGILAVRSDPANAEIFVNGKLALTRQGDVKFLPAGEYQLDLKKEGYQSWSKRLAVYPGRVTWANPGFNKVNLFFSQPKIQDLENSVVDFYVNGGRVAYLTAASLVSAAVSDVKNNLIYPLPQPLDKILTADDRGNNLILAQTRDAANPPTIFAFNSSTGKFYNLSGLFNTLPKLQFDANGNLYALDKNILYAVDIFKKAKTPVLPNLKAFYWLEDSLYFIQFDDNQNFSLMTGHSPFKDNQSLLAGLPAIEEGALLVTFEKQILLLSGGNLFLAGKSMEKLADDITSWNFDHLASSLAVIHSGQLDYYVSGSPGLNFVTRLSGTINQPMMHTGLAGAFFINDERLVEIELDTRDNQNQNALYQGKNLQTFWVNSSGTNVLLLDGGELKSLVIR